MKSKLIIVVFILALTAPLMMAQDADFFELPFAYNGYLYPDYRYFINPAIANKLQQSFDEYDGSLDFDRNATKDIRTVDGPGLVDGVDKWARTWIDPDLSFGRFTKKDGKVNRIGARFAPYFMYQSTKTVDFNSAGEDIKTSDMDFYLDTSGNYLQAWQENGTARGFYGSLSLYWDPVREEFTRTTDVNTNGGEKYISAGGGTAVYAAMPIFSYGIMKEDNGIWYSLGSRAAFAISDFSTDFIAVDTDADGFDDKVVTVKNWWTSTEAWGAGNPYYKNRDQIQTYFAAIYPSMIKPLDGGKDLILSGRLDLIDLQRTVTYTHTVDTDESKNEILVGSYATSGIFFAGFRKQTDFGAECRYGLYTDFDVDFRKENDLDVAGADTFDPANKKHYVEVAWGADPDDGDVTASAGNPSLAIDTSIGAISGMQWRISPEVVFFGSGHAEVNFLYDSYKVFDTATGTVWTEWDMRNDMSFDISGDFGLQFALPKGTFITVSGVLPNLLTGTTTDNFLDFDPTPTSDAGDSAGVTADKNLLNGQGFTITVEVTVRR